MSDGPEKTPTTPTPVSVPSAKLDLLDVIRQAGLTDADVTQRVAEIALMADDPSCPVWLKWDIVHVDVIRNCIQEATKKNRIDDDKLAKLLVRRCCKSIENLTFNAIKDWGLLALDETVTVKLLAVITGKDAKTVSAMTEDEREDAGEVMFDGSPALAVWMARESRPFRMRALELQDTANILFAEEALRKKRSAAISSTAA